jgi:signal transduction histidine kinase
VSKDPRPERSFLQMLRRAASALPDARKVRKLKDAPSYSSSSNGAILDSPGGRLIDAQEEERSRIAWELHEDLSQRMALLSTEIEQLAQLASLAAPEVSAGLREALIEVRDVSSKIHRLSYELHPCKLDRLGLATASMSLCKELSKEQGMHVECIFKNIPDTLPGKISLCLYRIIQESLRNVVKHSGACNATVEMYGSPSEIRLRITDEGVGFDPESVGRKRGLGLLSMRERLRLLGGTIAIESRPLCGTRIAAAVPLFASGAEPRRVLDGLQRAQGQDLPCR